MRIVWGSCESAVLHTSRMGALSRRLHALGVLFNGPGMLECLKTPMLDPSHVTRRRKGSTRFRLFATYIHAYIHTHIHTYIRTYIHTYMHTYIHTYIHYITLHCTTLQYITLNYNTLHYNSISFHYITLHCNTYITYVRTYTHTLHT